MSDPKQNPKGTLYEQQQQAGQANPKFMDFGAKGPDHQPVHKAGVRTADGNMHVGTGPTKQAAGQAAAQKALDHGKQ